MYGINMRQISQILFLGILTLTGLSFWACANIGTISGGPEDKEAPKVVQEESTPNMKTNFEGRSFELKFNEYVKLQDAFNQVVVSPPLEYKPEVTLKKGEVVRFEFDGKEVLREDATYTINFGSAIKDLNAGNAAENLRFVFSTGDFIDSLTVRGSIVDAFTGDPVPEILFMLYDNLADSVVRTERPFYFAKTGKDGSFLINNVKSDTFKIFALKDNNLNYKFDLDNEIIGFSEEPIMVTDSTQSTIKLTVFEQTKSMRLLNKSLGNYGHVKLVFNQSDPNVVVTFQDVGQKHSWHYEKDTIHLWYDLTDSVDWNIYVQSDTILNDTLLVKSLNRADFLEKAKLKAAANTLLKAATQNPYLPMKIVFNRPLEKWDTSAIVLLEDTLKVRVYPEISIDEKDKKVVSFSYRWKEDLPYTLQLFPKALTDIYGLEHDTLRINTRVIPKAQFGNLKLKINGMKSDTNYVVKLMDNKKELSVNSFQSDSSYVHDYGYLPSGNYSVQIIEDVNGNNKWDPGDYDLKKQPERLFFRKLDELRAGWELESEVTVDK